MKETKEEISEAIEIVITALYEKLDYLKENTPNNIEMIEYVRHTIYHLSDFENEFQ